MQKRTCCFSIVILALSLFVFQPVAANTQSPTLRLFPTTVVENIKQTGEAAMAMEESLQDIMLELSKQMESYDASSCDGAEADQGCSEIVRQLSQTYIEMLTQMEGQLPKMERSIGMTKKSLEKRLRQEIGRKMTARDMQKSIAGKSLSTEHSSPSYTRRGRLSEKFKQYYDLVAMGSRMGGNGSLIEVAAEMYLDTRDVTNMIAMTRDEIGRARIFAELNQAYAMITPEMNLMVKKVKVVIFGEVEDGDGIPGPIAGSGEGVYISPLEE